MNLKKIVVSTAVASILLSGGIVGTSFVQAAGEGPDQQVRRGFLAQENDNYEYGEPHVCAPQLPQDINTWRQHPENIPWGECPLEDGIVLEAGFDIQTGEAYPFNILLPERDDKTKFFRVSNDENSQASIKATVISGNQVVEEFTVRPNETILSNGYNSSNTPGEYQVRLEKIGHGQCDGKIADVIHYQR